MAPPKPNTTIGQARTGSFGTASAYGQAIQNIDGTLTVDNPTLPVNAFNEYGTNGGAAIAIVAKAQQQGLAAALAAGSVFGTNSPELQAFAAINRPVP